jgi:hypothetical protein
MLLAFLVPLILFAVLLFTKKKLLRRHWYILFSFGLIFALLLSLVSVIIVWNPNELSLSLPNGDYSGVLAVSYPVWMNVYVTPYGVRILVENGVLANVSFSVFIANYKLLEVSGTLRYAAVLGSAPVHYDLGSPFYSNKIAFFGFLVFLFSLLNIIGFALAMILCYIVSRTLRSKRIDHSP